MFDDYEMQEKQDPEDAEYGVNHYNDLMREFHADVMKLLQTKKYGPLEADEAMVVFGRIYGVFVLSQSMKEGKIEFRDKNTGEDNRDV